MEKFRLEGPEGPLQAVYECSASTPHFLMVAGHPHPLHGGTMDNKVVTTLTRVARDAGAATLRFNFRGVGESAGAFDDAIGETDDLLAAVSWLRGRWPALPLWLAGFSFGSYVAVRAARALNQAGQPQSGLLLVAPPVHHYPFDEIDSVGSPVWLVQGDEDEVVPADEVLSWARQSPLKPEIQVMPGCGHFFHGRLTELKDRVALRFP